MLFDHSGVYLPGLRTVKLSPTVLTWLFRKICTIRISGGLVPTCQRTQPYAALPPGRRVGRFSHRNAQDHPHDPDMLSLRQDSGEDRHKARTGSVGTAEGAHPLSGTQLAKTERGPIATSGPTISVWHQTWRSLRKNQSVFPRSPPLDRRPFARGRRRSTPVAPRNSPKRRSVVPLR